MLAALSLAWPYIAGLGGLPALVVGSREPSDEATNLRLLAAVWSFGLCLNYALLLLLGQLTPALAAGCLISLCLGLAALWRCRARFARPDRWRPWLIAFGVLVGGTFAILLDPLQDWDARSIWFFHGKMIFYSGGLTTATGLDLAGVPHPNYPKLVPALAGQIAAVIGFWNEYLPKLSLALLLPVPILTVLTLRRTPVSMTLAILAFILITNQFLSNGSMDGYLAIYAACAAFFLVDWLEGGGDAAFLAAAGTLGVAGGLKVEGQVVYLSLALAFAVLLAMRKLSLPRPSRPALFLAALPFAGLILWHVLVFRWALKGDAYSFAQAWLRLGDPLVLWQIVHQALLHSRLYVPVLILLGILALARFRGMRLSSSAMLPLLAGLIYLAAVCLVFAMTPMDLMVQLATAAGRVVRSGTELLLVGAVLVARDLERATGNRLPDLIAALRAGRANRG